MKEVFRSALKNNPELSRFEREMDGLVGFVEYRMFDGGFIYSHTEVDPGLAGKGVGLAKHSLEFVAENKIKLVLTCRFINVYIK